MPSKFQNLVDAYLNPVVDDHFGEPFTLRPMVSTPNSARENDPSRSVVSDTGVVHRTDREAAIETGNRDRAGNTFRTLLSPGAYDLCVDRQKLPQGARQGDEVELRGDTYQVLSAEFDGIARWILRLIK